MRLLLSIYILMFCSSCDHSILEGNTTVSKKSYIHWFVRNDLPQTCFLQEGADSKVFNASLADKPAEFSFGKFKYKSLKSKGSKILQITNLDKNLVLEEVDMAKFIYMIHEDRYVKILQTKKIKSAMLDDYNVMGGTNLLNELKILLK